MAQKKIYKLLFPNKNGCRHGMAAFCFLRCTLWMVDRPAQHVKKKKSYLQVLTLNFMSLGIVFIVALKLSWTPCPNQGSSDFGFQSQSGSI